MSNRHSYQTIKDSFNGEGYTLLSKEYKNALTKLEFVCSVGHKHYIRWNSWQQGGRCPYCSGQGRPVIVNINKSFEMCGYRLLSKEYVNNKTVLEFVCPKGHSGYIRWNDWQQGHRCRICSREIVSVKQRTDTSKVMSAFEQEGWKLYNFEYIEAHQKIECECPRGHKQNKTWHHWRKGQRCKICTDAYKSGPNHHLWKGGLSYEPYCPVWQDKEYKEDIKARDGYKCLNPSCSKKNNKLHIHHIDYNKKNCSPSNLITVCNSCNSAANKDREWHTAWYQAIMLRRAYITL